MEHRKEPESLRVLTRRRLDPQEDDQDPSKVDPHWIPTKESEFWTHFFTLIDHQDGTLYEKEFRARVTTQYDNGISWNFWTDDKSPSYKSAIKKVIERIGKIGGFSRDETIKLKELTDEVVTHRQSHLKKESKSYNDHLHVHKMWIELRTSLDHPPLTWRRVADLLCDVLVGMIAVSIFILFVVGIFTFLSKYK